MTRVVMSNDVNDLELRVPNLGRKWSTIITRFLFVRLCCIRKLRIGLDGNLSISAGFGFYRHSVFFGSFLMKKKKCIVSQADKIETSSMTYFGKLENLQHFRR